MLPKCLHVGSVKNIHGEEGKAPYYFEFSDRYSVFDWGSMPDNIEGKGEVLATMANFFFEYLSNPVNWKQWQPTVAELSDSEVYHQFCESGLNHHGLGLVDKELNSSALSNIYKVCPVKVIRPQGSETASGYFYNYSEYQNKVTDALVPLEVIFRFGVPNGSSLMKRVKDENYLAQLGLDKAPNYGDEFETPVIEFSTKLESVDRYINYAQAKEIAGLSDREFQNLIDTTKLLVMRLKDLFAGVDVKLWDGKFEYAFSDKLDAQGDRSFMLVDSIGIDELRLTYDGVQLSKECLRKFYRKTPWYENVEKSKEIADQEGVEDWKSICIERLNSTPAALDPKVKQTVEMMYKSLLRELYGKYLSKNIYPDSWDLGKVAQNLTEILND